MERFDWQRTIRITILSLKIVGLWPPDSYGKNLYTLYAAFCIVFFQLALVFIQTANLILVIDDLQAVTASVFVLSVEMLAQFKSYCLIKNMRRLKKLMDIVNSDLFQPKDLRQQELVRPNLENWTKVVASFWFFTIGWIIFYMLSPVFDKTVSLYQLPFPIWYPFNTKVSPQYELVYIHQFTSIACISMVTLNVDSLVAALNMYIAAQIDILSDNLQNFAKDSCEIIDGNLRQCVHHHREILRFAAEANVFYNWLIFVEFFVGGVAIGLAMFQMTLVVPFTNEFHSFIIYVNAISTQVFMYCWFGNEIEIKSSKLPYSVFISDWTGLSSNIKRKLNILLLKLQTPLKMSAFGLFYLSLETFVRILRTAWSYFALLRQVNTPH